MVSDLPKVTELVNGRIGILIQDSMSELPSHANNKAEEVNSIDSFPKEIKPYFNGYLYNV